MKVHLVGDQREKLVSLAMGHTAVEYAKANATAATFEQLITLELVTVGTVIQPFTGREVEIYELTEAGTQWLKECMVTVIEVHIAGLRDPYVLRSVEELSCDVLHNLLRDELDEALGSGVGTPVFSVNTAIHSEYDLATAEDWSPYLA